MASHTTVRHSGVQPTEHMHLFTHETPDFITPALWPANSPDLNPVDCQIWWKLQDRVYRSHVTRPAEVVPDRRVGTFPPGGRQWHPRLGACVRLRARGGHCEHRL